MRRSDGSRQRSVATVVLGHNVYVVALQRCRSRLMHEIFGFFRPLPILRTSIICLMLL